MRRWLAYISALSLVACAVAFTPGNGEPRPPPKFQDPDTSSHHEEEKKEEGNAATAPSFGMSLVVGGTPFDAGMAFPKPLFPVVLVP